VILIVKEAPKRFAFLNFLKAFCSKKSAKVNSFFRQTQTDFQEQQKIFKNKNVSQTVPIKEIREPGGSSRSSGQPAYSKEENTSSAKFTKTENDFSRIFHFVAHWFGVAQFDPEQNHNNNLQDAFYSRSREKVMKTKTIKSNKSSQVADCANFCELMPTSSSEQGVSQYLTTGVEDGRRYSAADIAGPVREDRPRQHLPIFRRWS